MFTKTEMQLRYIEISADYRKHKPNQEKLEACREYYAEHGVLDRDICVDDTGCLYDGYVGYLVLKENNVLSTEVICEHDGNLPELNKPVSERKRIYVFGRHPGDMKEYVWKVNNNTKDRGFLKVGNHAIVIACGQPQRVLITRVERLSTPPRDGNIKSVVKGVDE